MRRRDCFLHDGQREETCVRAAAPRATRDIQSKGCWLVLRKATDVSWCIRRAACDALSFRAMPDRDVSLCLLIPHSSTLPTKAGNGLVQEDHARATHNPRTSHVEMLGKRSSFTSRIRFHLCRDTDNQTPSEHQLSPQAGMNMAQDDEPGRRAASRVTQVH